MDEFIREVDEEYRREQIAQIWRRFGGLIVGLAVLLVVAVGGWRYWQHVERQRAEAAATRFADAVQLSQEGKRDESEKALEAIAKEAPSGYRLLARFRLAAELGRQSPEEGVKAYEALAADSAVEGALRDLAKLRANALRLGTADEATGLRNLEGLASPTSLWRHAAREYLGLAALKRDELEAAGRWFDQIAADRDTPAGLRGRLEIYTALVAGGPVQTTQ